MKFKDNFFSLVACVALGFFGMVSSVGCKGDSDKNNNADSLKTVVAKDRKSVV